MRERLNGLADLGGWGGGHGGCGHGCGRPTLGPWYLYWPQDAHFQTPAPTGYPFWPSAMTVQPGFGGLTIGSPVDVSVLPLSKVRNNRIGDVVRRRIDEDLLDVWGGRENGQIVQR